MRGKISSASKPQFTGPLSAFLTTSLLLKFISTMNSGWSASLSSLPVGNFFLSVLFTALCPNAPLGRNFLSLSDSGTGSSLLTLGLNSCWSPLSVFNTGWPWESFLKPLTVAFLFLNLPTFTSSPTSISGVSSVSVSATGSLVPLPVVGLPEVATLLTCVPAPPGGLTSGSPATLLAVVLPGLTPPGSLDDSSPASALDCSSVLVASLGKPAAFLSRSAFCTSALSWAWLPEPTGRVGWLPGFTGCCPLAAPEYSLRNASNVLRCLALIFFSVVYSCYSNAYLLDWYAWNDLLFCSCACPCELLSFWVSYASWYW